LVGLNNLIIYMFATTIHPNAMSHFVATLALSLQSMQGLAKVRAESEAQESHFMLLGM
jgi:hypothetical protein